MNKPPRIYLHDSGRAFTFCPEDGRGDVVLLMPEWHPSPTSDYNRLKQAIEDLEAFFPQSTLFWDEVGA